MMGIGPFWRVTFSVFSHYSLFWTQPDTQVQDRLSVASSHVTSRGFDGAAQDRRLETTRATTTTTSST